MTPEEKAKWQKQWIETFANKPYQPTNGTEGMSFIDKFCANCIHEKWMHTPEDDNAKKCEVLTNTFVDDDFSQWFYDDKGSPYCKCFQKWDWGNDDDNNGLNEPPIIEPDDPMQLVFPFIIESVLYETEIA